jgi:hypothetical protein
LCYNPRESKPIRKSVGELFVRFKFLKLFAAAWLLTTSFSFVFAQETTTTATEKPKENKKQSSDKKAQAADAKNPTAEQVAESVIIIYGSLGGRDYLKQIRKTTIERGKISFVNSEGKTEQTNYERLIMRGDSLDKERIRFDQEYPSGKFALVYNNDKVFGIFNEAVFAPREDATKSFQNQIWHGLEALLRYKENGSTVALAKREKLMGVEFHLLDVTDKQNRKTRFYISTKTLRVMMLEYEQDGVNYRRRFYDYNYAQGTLVPFRTVLWANDKQIEETSIQTISFGQKVGEDIFKEN